MATLASTLVRDDRALTDAGLITTGAALTALAAQVSIPWQPVPFTLQTLAVCLAGLTLGSRRGTLSMLAYVTAGTAGVPVFAEGKFGPQVLAGPTGGYLIGFIVAAGIMGFLAERGWDRNVFSCVGALVLGHIALLGLGFGWLSLAIGTGPAWDHGVMPFLVGDGLKIAMAMLLVPGAWQIVKALDKP